MVQNVNFAPVEHLVMEQQVKVVFYVSRSLLLSPEDCLFQAQVIQFHFLYGQHLLSYYKSEFKSKTLLAFVNRSS